MDFIEPEVVNKYKVDMSDPDIVYIGRGSAWENPWTHLKTKTKARYVVETREDAIEAYRQALWSEIREKEDHTYGLDATRRKTPRLLLLAKVLPWGCVSQSCCLGTQTLDRLILIHVKWNHQSTNKELT